MENLLRISEKAKSSLCLNSCRIDLDSRSLFILFGTLFVSLETNQNIRKMLSKISNIEKKVNQIENNSRSDPSI